MEFLAASIESSFRHWDHRQKSLLRMLEGAMNWLLNNPVVNVDSEYLLLFYAIAIGAVILACYKSVRSADRTRHMEPPEIPLRLDPYELAYLRGGETEVTRIAIISLLQRGLLKITESRDWSSTALAIRKEVDRGRKPEPGELSPIEACITKWTGFPATGRQIYQPDGTPFKTVSLLFWEGNTGRYIYQPGSIPALIRAMCDHYRDNLTANQLLAPPEMKQLGSLLWCIGSALILGLGGYLLEVALAKGEPLVAVILCPMVLIGVIALSLACLEFPRISQRGRAYLEQLELAYDRLRSTSCRRGRWKFALTKAGDSGDREPMRDSSVFSDRLLMDGIFGEVSAADTPLNDLWNAMVRYGVVLAPGEEPPKG
jgi:hypothetical protein